MSEAQVMDHFLPLFPGHEQGAGSKAEQPGHEPVHIWDAWLADSSFTHYDTTTAPEIYKVVKNVQIHIT